MKMNEKIKNKREELGLTLQEVGEFIGVSKATVQRYESGEIKNLKLESIEKLATILKTSPAYLMGWEDTKEDEILNNNNLSKKETTLISDFNKLNSKGKDEAIKRVEELTYIPAYTEVVATKEHLIPIAAHKRDNIIENEEDKKHDMDIMMNEDEWK